MIALSNVSKRLGQGFALAPTTLEIAAGERLAIVGASGCGKSTLLRLMIGLVTPDEGAIAIAGTKLTPESAPALRLRIGYVIQDGGLFPHLTNDANVRLVAKLRGWAPARIEERIAQLSEMVRLDRALLVKFPSQLSGGQRQRVGLMRALMLDPDVILLDEPLGALDAIVRARLQEELAELMTRLKKCVVIVTHDLLEAARFGETIAVMKDGKILQRAPVRTLIDAPADPYVAELLLADGVAKRLS